MLSAVTTTPAVNTDPNATPTNIFQWCILNVDECRKLSKMSFADCAMDTTKCTAAILQNSTAATQVPQPQQQTPQLDPTVVVPQTNTGWFGASEPTWFWPVVTTGGAIVVLSVISILAGAKERVIYAPAPRSGSMYGRRSRSRKAKR
jgi:hypothetical protein